MILTSSNFDTYNTSNQKNPCAVVDINGLTNQYMTKTFSGAGSTYKKYLKNVTVHGMSVDLLKFETTFPGFDFDVIDYNGEIRGLFTNYLANRKVTLYLGYEELALSDFITMPEAYIKRIELQDDLITYRFRCRSKWEQFKKPLFNAISDAETELTGALAIGGNTATVADSSSGFTTAGSASFNNDSDTYLIIGGEEIVKYTAQPTGTTFTITRAQFGTQAKAWADGDSVKEVYRIHSHPMEVLLWVLQTTSGGSNGNYDLGLSDWGLGIADAELDEIQMVNEWEKWKDSNASDDFKDWLIFDRIEDGWNWIKNHLLPYLPGFFILTENRTIGCRIWDIVVPNQGVNTLNDNDIMIAPKISIKSNELTNYREDSRAYIPGKNYTNIVESKDTGSDGTYGEIGKLKLAFPNSDTAWDATELTNYDDRFWGRVGEEVAKIKFRSRIENCIYQAGDIINLTHSKLPLARDGSLGWTTEGVEVISNRIYLKAGEGYYSEFEVENCMWQDVSGHVVAAGNIYVASYSDLEDGDLTLDANHAAGTLNAADAYWNRDLGSAPYTWFIVKIQADCPNSGSVNRTASFDIHVQNPAGTDLANETKNITFNTGWSGTRYWDLGIFGSFVTVSRIKIDYYATTAGSPLTNIKVHSIRVLSLGI